MSAILSVLAGVAGKASIAVTANNVTKVEQGFTTSGTVTSTQTPNPQVTGGVGPFTWSWAYVSGSLITSISDSSVANPQWEASVLDGEEETSVWELTVTDAQMNTATVTITVLLAWFNLS